MSFLLIINHLPILANAIIFGSIVFIYSLNKNIKWLQVLIRSFILFGFMQVLSIYGQLNMLYKGLTPMLLLLSLNLVLVYDYLNLFNNIDGALKPFLIFLTFASVMLITAILVKDVKLFNLVYPKGITSILTLIILMCMPYLLTMTFTFLAHD